MRSFIFDIRYDAGTILKIEPTGVWIAIYANDVNKSACAGCRDCLPSKTAFKLFVIVTDTRLYSLNQNVVVKRTLPNKGWAAAFIFGVPLLFAFASMLVWNYISSQTAGSPLSIGAMVAAVFFGFVTVSKGDAFFRNRFPARIHLIAAPDDVRHSHG
jgi:Positive regulator of sigma(E), RseC/MucC